MVITYNIIQALPQVIPVFLGFFFAFVEFAPIYVGLAHIDRMRECFRKKCRCPKYKMRAVRFSFFFCLFVTRQA